jgi:hypothetical protein
MTKVGGFLLQRDRRRSNPAAPEWQPRDRRALFLVNDATGLCKRMAEISAARIDASPARQIFNPAHSVGGGAHRLAS